MDLSMDLFMTRDDLSDLLAFGGEQGARVVHDIARGGAGASDVLSFGEPVGPDVARIVGESPHPGSIRFYFLMDPSASNPQTALSWYKVFLDYGGEDQSALYKSRLTTRTSHDATGSLARKVQRRVVKMAETQPPFAGGYWGTDRVTVTRGAARLYRSGMLLRDCGASSYSWVQTLLLKDLPHEIGELVVSAVHTLARRGPHGLVEAGLCPPDWEATMTECMNDYPGEIVSLPDSAALSVSVDRDGNLDIDLPLHEEHGAPMDLHIFLRIEPNTFSMKVTNLYAP